MWFVSFAKAQGASDGGLLRAIVEAATARGSSPRWRTAIRCPGGGTRKRCRGRLDVELDESGIIGWGCAECSRHGFVVDFAETDADLSRYAARGKTVLWGIDDREREFLLVATAGLPQLRAVIARARPHREIAGLLLVDATAVELDALYTLVEEVTDGTWSRRQREILGGLRASLCSAIDGF